MKTKLLLFGKAAIPIMFFSGCAYHPMDGSMRGWDHMLYSGYGRIFMMILMIIIVIAVAYFGIYLTKTAGTSARSPEENSTEILKKRYAKGEISKEEFERIKKDLEG
ncbi:MAG: SHOCT domain-containing protein [Desulfuromonas sp.]